jgi:hypothetical protein
LEDAVALTERYARTKEEAVFTAAFEEGGK